MTTLIRLTSTAAVAVVAACGVQVYTQGTTSTLADRRRIRGATR